MSCRTGTVACCGPRLGVTPVLLSPRATRVFSAPELGPSLSFGCLAAGLSASAHQVEHEPNHTVVVLLKQAKTASSPRHHYLARPPPVKGPLRRYAPLTDSSRPNNPASIEEDAPTG